MKRNTGLIGSSRRPSLSSSPGVFDTFDAYNWRRLNNWPLSFRYVSLSPGSGTINENSSTTFTLTTEGFETNTTLYWTVLNGSTTNSDFFSSVVSGSFTQSAITNTGSFTVNTALIGNTAKATRTFQIQIRTGSVGGTVVFTSGTFSIPAITSTVSWSVTPVNEGSSTNLQVALGNIGNRTTYSASISYSGTAVSGDFTSGLPASMTIGSGTYTLSFSAIADLTTEGSETLTATVTYGGFTLGNPTLTISDTSQTPSASLSHASSVNEGSSITFTVTTTNFSSGTLYYTLENVSNWESSDQTAISGSFTVTGSSGSFTVTTVADGYTEGAEVFLARVRLNSTTGTIIGSSSNVTINDTSTGTPEPTELYAFSTVTFGAGTTGPTGPTLAQVQGAMTGTPTPSNWNTSAANLSVTSGIILWTAPVNATYRITAAGASGYPQSTTNRGATIQGDFSLTQGQKLRIVVGQYPTAGTGGGGGSYVIKETGSTAADIFVIAGGGGGKSGGAGGTATTSNSSGTVSNGNGGLANNNSWNGPAGGGFFTSGTVSTGSPRGNVGSGFLQGSAGGAASPSGPGGFGGGGSGGGDGAAGGGAGGGYSGGSGGGDGSSGQGAGSYPNGTNQVNTANSNTLVGGYVTIQKL